MSKGLSFSLETRVNYRAVERSMDGISKELKNMNPRSPVSRSIRREIERINRAQKQESPSNV